MMKPDSVALSQEVSVGLVKASELTREMVDVDNLLMTPLVGQLTLRGEYIKVEVVDVNGKVKYVQEGFHNDITNAGKNALLDSFFRNQSPPATWYFGLVDNSGFTAFAAGDTMSSHAGWTEFTTYSDSTRVAWTTVTAASQSITNTSVSTFNINGSGTVKGVFVTSVSTKAGTTGTLWSTAAFTSAVPVSNGDQLKITYTVNA